MDDLIVVINTLNKNSFTDEDLTKIIFNAYDKYTDTASRIAIVMCIIGNISRNIGKTPYELLDALKDLFEGYEESKKNG